MNPDHTLLVHLPRELSDTSAVELIDLLYQFVAQLEHHYAAQLRRDHEPDDERQCDFWQDPPPPL